MAKIELQRGFILHSKPYRDSSNLLEVFSEEHGRQSMVARGARSARSKMNGILQPFIPLLLSWTGKGELHTLTAAEQASKSYSLKGNILMIGFYLNELIIQFLHRDDPHAELFQRYEQTLQALENCDSIEPLLRIFERDLLCETGYGMSFDADVETGEVIASDCLYNYVPEKGPVKTSIMDKQLLQVHGKTLLALQDENFVDDESLLEAKKLMRYLIAWHMGGKPLKTREMFRQQSSN